MRIGDQPLDTIILEPKNRAPKYTIIWSNGICTTYKDYMLLLGPLSEEARIIAYNYRSHGGSKERFSPRGAVKELEGLVEDQDGPVFLGGHCTGAAISSSVKSDVQGRVLVCPYLGSDYLSTLPKAIMRLGRLLPICYMDRFIDYTGLVKCFGCGEPKAHPGCDKLMEVSAIAHRVFRDVDGVAK